MDTPLQSLTKRAYGPDPLDARMAQLTSTPEGRATAIKGVTEAWKNFKNLSPASWVDASHNWGDYYDMGSNKQTVFDKDPSMRNALGSALVNDAKGGIGLFRNVLLDEPLNALNDAKRTGVSAWNNGVFSRSTGNAAGSTLGHAAMSIPGLKYIGKGFSALKKPISSAVLPRLPSWARAAAPTAGAIALPVAEAVGQNVVIDAAQKRLETNDQAMVRQGAERIGQISNAMSPSISSNPDTVRWAANRFLPDAGQASSSSVERFIRDQVPETKGTPVNFGEKLLRYGGQDTANIEAALNPAPTPAPTPTPVPTPAPAAVPSLWDTYKYPAMAAGGLAAGAGILAWYNNKKQREAEEQQARQIQHRRLMPRRPNMA